MWVKLSICDLLTVLQCLFRPSNTVGGPFGALQQCPIFPKFDLTLAELHLKVALDHIVGIVVGVGVHLRVLKPVGVHLTVLKPVPINSAWSKTYIWTPRSTFYNARELSYTLNWLWTILLPLFLVLVYIEEF